MKKKIIWTRSRDDLLSDRGFLSSDLVLCLPGIQRFPLAISFENFSQKKWDAAIFTSRYAAKLACEHLGFQQLFQSCSFVFCLTSGIADLLEKKFALKSVVLKGTDKGSDMLEAILATKLLPPQAAVLLIGAQDKAFDMKTPLSSYGFFVQNLDLYVTQSLLTDEKGLGLDQKTKQTLMEKRWVVCFASPSAVIGFVGGFPSSFKFDNFYDAVVIGPTTAAQAKKYFSHVHQTEKPSVKEMHDLALQLVSRKDL